MKKHTFIILLLLISTLALAQKKEKIKGSKTVMIEKKEIGDFEAIEVSDNVSIYLEKGEKNELKIEADENLHGIIKIDLTDKTLRINTSKTASNFKKLIVRITYSNALKSITSKNESVINAIAEIQLTDIAVKSFDDSKLFLNVNAKNFTLQSDHNSKVELNVKSEKATIELSKNANLKALITATDLKFDMYQKSTANLEGDATNANIRLDNNSKLIGNNFVITNAQLLAESYSNCSLTVNITINIDATGNADMKLYGDPKIEIKRFAENAILSKKQIQ
jgi:Putative auto-transporter adhesin, head GIN domain